MMIITVIFLNMAIPIMFVMLLVASMMVLMVMI